MITLLGILIVASACAAMYWDFEYKDNYPIRNWVAAYALAAMVIGTTVALVAAGR